MGMNRSGLGTPTIQHGQIGAVNPDKWTCTVIAQQDQKTIPDVHFLAPFLNSFGGHGLSVMPESGAFCTVCIPSTRDSRAFIIGYRSPTDSEGTHRGNRVPLDPGDISLSTAAGNHVKVLSGGLTEVAASSLAKRSYVPSSNSIVDVAQVYTMTAAGGTHEWRCLRTEEDPDGKSITQMRIRAKECAEDAEHVVELALGGDIPGTQNVYSLRVFDGGNPVGAQESPTFNQIIKKDGGLVVDSRDVVFLVDNGQTFTISDSALAITEGVLLPKAFLGDLMGVLNALTALVPRGYVPAAGVQMIASIIQAQAGQGPYVSKVLKVSG